MSPTHDRDPVMDPLLARVTRAATGNPGACPDAETLAAWFEQGAASNSFAAVELHVATCVACQTQIGALARADMGEASREAVPAWRGWVRANWWAPAVAVGAVVVIALSIRPPTSPPPDLVARVDVGGAAAPTVEPEAPGEATAKAPVDQTLESLRLERFAEQADAARADQAARRETAEFSRSGVGGATGATPGQPVQIEAARNRAANAVGGAAASGNSAEAERREETNAAIRPTAPAPTAPPVPEAPSPTAAALEAPAVRRPEQGSESSRAAAAAPASVAAPPPATPGLPRGAPVTTFAPDVPLILRTAAGQARWRVFSNGRVERSADGVLWQALGEPVSAGIRAGSSPSATVCWLVGANGAVWLSVDGAAFTRLPFPEVVDLARVSATDGRSATVTAADGRVFRTTDQGGSWLR